MTLTRTNGGGGGGSSLTVKDEGSTLSSAVTSIDVVGPTLTATGTTAVTLTGVGLPYYAVDNTSPVSPNVADDEFSTGSSIDTAGSRFGSATAWAWRNQSTATSTVTGGSLFLTSTAAAGTIHFVEQTLAAGTFIYETLMLGIWGNDNSWGHSGIFVLNTGGTVPSLIFGTARGDEGNGFQVLRFNSTTFSGTSRYSKRSHVGMNGPGVFLRIERTSAPNLLFSVSRNKRKWFQILSIAESTDFASAANRIGLFHVASGGTGGSEAEFEYFRRIA